MKNYNDIYDKKQRVCAMMDEAYSKEYDTACDDCEIAIQDSYQKGLDDAWECAKKIAALPSDGGFSATQLTLIFNQGYVAGVVAKYSASEAIAKIKEYEEKKKTDEEIKVGDEVMVDERHMIVLGVDSGGWKQLWCPSNGLVYDNITTSEMTKTGRHFDIQSILDQMINEQ